MSELPNLSALKYSELQKIAKDVGIRANMKSEKLMKALEDHYQNKGVSDTVSETKSSDPEVVLQGDELPVTQGTQVTQNNKPHESETKELKNETREHKCPKKQGKKTQTVKVDKDGETEHRNIPMEKKVKVERQKRKLSDTNENNIQEVKSGETNEAEADANERRPTKRRRSTFDIVPSPEVCDSVEENSKQKEAKKDSLGEMMEVMKPEMTTEDLKDSLMAAIEKKVEEKMTNEDAKEGSTSHIPRFAAFLAKKKAEVMPITPGNKNWTKIHEKNFSRMDSIDVYLEKKKKRNVSISNSMKQAREVASKTREAMLKLKNHKTPEPNKIHKGLPLPFRSPFKPTITSTKSMKLKFGGNAKTPVFGRKTPTVSKTPVLNKSTSVRKSPRDSENVPAIKVTKPEVQPKMVARKSIGVLNSTLQPEKRKSCVTPFKPMNVTLESQSTKKMFDLKASLSKPLTWKPYTGKLKPIEKKPNPVSTSKSHNIDIKAAPKKTSRDHRIADAKGRRADKKFNDQMKRRGIVA